jgi:hypothetical protein
MVISNSIFVSSVLFLCSLPIPSISGPLPNEDIAIIRQRVLELTIWPTKENIPATVQDAISYSHTLNSSCYWPDINYVDKSIVVWSTETHMYRITTICYKH